MPRHNETLNLAYTADEMFAVVADIERYPEFLPWCSALKVKSREEKNGIETVLAEMFVSYRGLNERYISRVRSDRLARTIEAVHVEGPFQRLDTRWQFIARATGSEVRFSIDFAFKNVILSTVAGVAFSYVASRMAAAFVQRAHALYGKGRNPQLAAARN